MTRENIEKYKSSLSLVKTMLKQGLITEKEYDIAEDKLAKKYCIKKDSIYRANDLIYSSKRVIYVLPKKEVQNEQDNNENRSVTEVRKEA